MRFTVARFSDQTLPPIGSLASSAAAEGLDFVARTLDDWLTSANAFDGPSEVFYLAWSNHSVVGMCGLNEDPFLEPGSRIGRLRHLYVAPATRRRGVGSALVAACVASATDSFVRIRLRTFDADADTFYRSIGFIRVDEPNATHSMVLSP